MKKFLWLILSSFLVALLILGLILYYFFGDWLKAIRELPSTATTQEETTPPSSNGIPASKNQTNLELKLPAGFTISYFAQKLGAPRVLIEDPNGTLITSITKNGKVLALPDVNKDGKADQAITILEKAKNPHGLAFRCKEMCQLYVAESHELNRYDYDQKTYQLSNKTFIVDFPDDAGRHFTRTLLYEPREDRILISIGSTCDVCHEKDWRPGKILSAYHDGADYKEFATGLRNSVFMKIHPVTGEIWATEMGRDWLGNDFPPDEVNIIKEGKNYGWPICYGKNIHDTQFDKNTYIRNPCMEPFEQPSHIDLQAHSAPLGLAFFSEEWPEEYRNDLLVAYHGSWNSSIPTGYKIVHYELDEQGNILEEEKDFISGWINTQNKGRPVDILLTPDRKIFISDDASGNIYLLQYQG